MVISTKPTRHLSCHAGTCTANQPNANLNVSDLADMLAMGDVTIVAKPVEFFKLRPFLF